MKEAFKKVIIDSQEKKFSLSHFGNGYWRIIEFVTTKAAIKSRVNRHFELYESA